MDQKAKNAAKQRRHRKRLIERDPEAYRLRTRLHKLKFYYGMDADDLHRLYAKQDGRCAICKHPEGEKRLHVDHDHDTGLVRGLLCGNCNALLGHARDSTEILRRAIYYLIDPPTLK